MTNIEQQDYSQHMSYPPGKYQHQQTIAQQNKNQKNGESVKILHN
jgi:hypothetical protein